MSKDYDKSKEDGTFLWYRGTVTAHTTACHRGFVYLRHENRHNFRVLVHMDRNQVGTVGTELNEGRIIWHDCSRCGGRWTSGENLTNGMIIHHRCDYHQSR